MFDAVIFDLYGTLVDIHTEEHDPVLWRSMARFYRRHGAVYTGPGLRQRYFALVDQFERETGEPYPEIRIEAVFSALFREKGAAADEALCLEAARRFRARSISYIRLFPGAWDLLDALRAAGKRVILLSNAQRAFTQAELDLLSLTERFDDIFLSSDAGVKKPDVRFFAGMLEKTGVEPARAVMVGNDARCDVGGAQAAGLAAAYLRTDVPADAPWPGCAFAAMGADYEKLLSFLLGGKKDGE